jgi:hypothetical protein
MIVLHACIQVGISLVQVVSDMQSFDKKIDQINGHI